MTTVPHPATIFDLTGRTALVTGASSGIGRRMAGVLAGAGCRVIVTARRADLLADLTADHPGMVAVAADLAVADERERLVAAAEAAVGGVDILVNNAGVITSRAIERETLDEFEAMVDVNLVAAWHLTKLVGTGMVERGRGSVVNVASIWGVVGATPIKSAGYAASKGALVNLTRELALQWARRGVRVNAICPGWIATEMNTAMQTDPWSLDVLERNGPMPRFGRPEELDGPLLLLASDAGSYMTGAVLMVDGGWTAR